MTSGERKRARGTETYYDYVLASDRWARKRARLLVSRGRRCQRCGVPESTSDLQLHHLTYERLGFEPDEDVELLCRRCHFVADREREQRADRRRAELLYAARLDGWATKRYGEYWQEHDYYRIQDEFDRWLDEREDDHE